MKGREDGGKGDGIDERKSGRMKEREEGGMGKRDGSWCVCWRAAKHKLLFFLLMVAGEREREINYWNILINAA